MGRIVCHLALHRSRTTALRVLDRILLASLAGNSVVALLAIVVAVHEVKVRVFVYRHLHLVHRERLGVPATRKGRAGRLGGRTLGTLLLHSVAGELRATDSQLLGAIVKGTATGTGHLEASVAGDGTLWGLVEVQARLLLIGTLVAGTRAGWQLVTLAPGSLLHLLAPDTPDLHCETTYGCSLLDSQKAQEDGYVGTHRNNQLKDTFLIFCTMNVKGYS